MYLLQDWTVVAGNGTTPRIQTLADWADLARFGDVVLWLEVRAVANPGAGNVTLDYETAPAKDDALFSSISTITLAPGSVPTVTRVSLASSPPVPVARWLRWKLRGTAAGDWSVCLRIHVCGGPALSRDFDARSIANCLAWYRASLGVADDGSGKASTWADQSGAGDANRNLSQATASKRPTIVPNDPNFNGRPTLSYDGVDDSLRSGAFSGGIYGQPITLYSVLCATSLAANRTIIDSADTTGFTRNVLVIAPPGYWVSYAGQLLVSAVASALVNTTYVACATFNGVISSTNVNRYNTAEALGNAGSQGLHSISVGIASDAATDPFVGQIAEVIAYSGAHTSAQRQSVMQALGAMYGVTVSA